MKAFLLTSVMAMLAAGIYGTIDLSLDLKNGTLIQYEDEEPAVMQKFAGNSRKNTKEVKLKPARQKEVSMPPVLLNDFSMSDFSRGEPPMFLEALMPLSDSLADSLNTDIAAALGDTVKALQEAARNEPQQKETTVKPKEVRKFSPRLFSRSKPRYYEREKEVAATDSVKADKPGN